MIGMEKTIQAASWHRGFITRLLPRTILVSVFLFWLSVNCFGIFGREYLEDHSLLTSFESDIPSAVSTKKKLNIHISWENQTYIRDRIRIDNLLPNFSFFLDTIILPGFPEFDDAGFSNSVFPLSGVLGASYYFIRNENLSFNMKAFAGAETIIDSFPEPFLVYGAFSQFRIQLFPEFHSIFTAAHADYRNYLFSGSILWDHKSIQPMISFLWENSDLALKAQCPYYFYQNFAINPSARYSLSYKGFYIATEFIIKEISLFSLPSDLEAGVEWNGAGWVSLRFNWNYYF